MNMRWTIVILVILGLAAAFAMMLLVGALRTDKEAKTLKGDVEVVVAKKSLPKMSVITSDSIDKKKASRAGLPEGSLTDGIQAIGRVLAVPVVEGQVLTKYCFITQGSGAQLAATLAPGMRAVSVPISGNYVMGGLLYPGCIVDVLSASRLSGPGNKDDDAISTPLLRGIQVLAVQEESIVSKPSEDKKAGGKKDYGGNLTVTLMVNTRQAEALYLAMESGRISLAMRNPLDKISADTEEGPRKAPKWPVTVIRGSERAEEAVKIQENEVPVPETEEFKN